MGCTFRKVYSGIPLIHGGYIPDPSRRYLNPWIKANPIHTVVQEADSKISVLLVGIHQQTVNGCGSKEFWGKILAAASILGLPVFP